MELKKSYLGFIIWCLAYVALLLCASFLPSEDPSFPIRVLFLLTSLSMVVLMQIMYCTEQVYWINGVSYEEAAEAGSERRRAFAMKHLKVFGLFALIHFAFTLLAHFLHFPFWIDIAVFSVGISAAAFSTMPFKL